MINLVIQITPEKIPELLNFLDEHRLNQNLPGRVVAFNPSLAGSYLISWQLDHAAGMVNGFLERVRAWPPIPCWKTGWPPIPGAATGWDLEIMHEALQLMVDEFNWVDGKVASSNWDGRPELWTKIVRDHPSVFGKNPVPRPMRK